MQDSASYPRSLVTPRAPLATPLAYVVHSTNQEATSGGSGAENLTLPCYTRVSCSCPENPHIQKIENPIGTVPRTTQNSQWCGHEQCGGGPRPNDRLIMLTCAQRVNRVHQSTAMRGSDCIATQRPSNIPLPLPKGMRLSVCRGDTQRAKQCLPRRFQPHDSDLPQPPHLDFFLSSLSANIYIRFKSSLCPSFSLLTP